MVVEDVLLSFGEEKRSKTTKEFRDTIEEMYSEGSSRVSAVTSRKTRWEDSPEGGFMGGDSGENIGEVSMNRP